MWSDWSLQNKLYLVANSNLDKANLQNQDTIFNKVPLILEKKDQGHANWWKNFINKMWYWFLKNGINIKWSVKQAVIAGLGCSIMPLNWYKKKWIG
jgi:hypothetical protein